MSGTPNLNITCSNGTFITFKIQEDTGDSINVSSNNEPYSSNIINQSEFGQFNLVVILQGGIKLQMDILTLPILITPLYTTSFGINFFFGNNGTTYVLDAIASNPWKIVSPLEILLSEITTEKNITIRFTPLTLIQNTSILIGYQISGIGPYLNMTDNPMQINWPGGSYFFGGLFAGSSHYNKVYRTTLINGGMLFDNGNSGMNIDVSLGSIITFNITSEHVVSLSYNNGRKMSLPALQPNIFFKLIVCLQNGNAIQMDLI